MQSINANQNCRSNNCNREKSENYYIEKCEYASESFISGNSVTFRVGEDENEIKANIVVEKKEKLKVWGQIKDCRGYEAAFLNVMLVSVGDSGYKCISETTTNNKGFYRFCVSKDNSACEYKVFVKRD